MSNEPMTQDQKHAGNCTAFVNDSATIKWLDNFRTGTTFSARWVSAKDQTPKSDWVGLVRKPKTNRVFCAAGYEVSAFYGDEWLKLGSD